MYLVCMHPNNSNNSFIRIKVPNLHKEIEDLMRLRKLQIKKLKAKKKKSLNDSEQLRKKYDQLGYL